MYEPNVIDTSDVTVSSEIENLAELLARNTHEVWSQGRIREGWTYGEKRDDAAKTHPAWCLMTSFQSRKRNMTAIPQWKP